MQSGPALALFNRMLCRRERLGWERVGGRLVRRAANAVACDMLAIRVRPRRLLLMAGSERKEPSATSLVGT